MRIIHDVGDGVSRRYMLKAAYPEVAGYVENERGYINVSL